MPRVFDATGLQVNTLDENRQDLRDRVIASPDFGDETEIGVDTPLGQVIDAVASQVTELDEKLLEVYDARVPGSARGVQLDNVAGLVGVIRKAAIASSVDLTLTGTPTTVIPAGSRARVPGGTIFAIVDDATIGGGGSVVAPSLATVTGPLEAKAGTVTQIVDPVVGWTSVTNVSAATVGSNEEKDSVLRNRRETDLEVGGTARDFAIRARLEQVTGMIGAAAISNRTLVTDAKGIPGKSFRPIVHPNTVDSEEVALAIWEVAPAGIFIDGAVEVLITDDQGYEQTIRFSYATQVEIFIVVRYEPGVEFPSTGVADIAQALRDIVFTIGEDVKPIALVKAICAVVPGIEHLVIELQREVAPLTTDTVPVEMDVDEIAFFDDEITVVQLP